MDKHDVKFRLVIQCPSTSSFSSSGEIVVNITDECCRQDVIQANDRAEAILNFFYPDNPFSEIRIYKTPIPEINVHFIPSLSIALQHRRDSVISCLRNKKFHDSIASGCLESAYNCFLFHVEEFTTYKEMAFVDRKTFNFIRRQEPDCPLSLMKYSEFRCCCWKDSDFDQTSEHGKFKIQRTEGTSDSDSGF